MRRRSALRNCVEYAVALAVLKSIEWSPRPVAEALARGYARLLDAAIPRLRQVALQNLAFALPKVTPEGRERIADGVFRSIARLLVAFAKLPRIGKHNVEDWIRYEGFEHFERGIAAGRGVLFATAHLGNWELSAHAHALMTGSMSVLVRPLDNPFIDALVERRRAGSGNQVLVKTDSARSILKALKENRAVGILIDQNASPENGVFIDFFGEKACAAAGFARIAAHSGAAVIPGFALWIDADQRYVLRFYPPVEVTGDVERDTQALQSVLEGVIRDYPDQWLWIHRRWKTRPDGAKSLYGSVPAGPVRRSIL
jgi:KDO2-lipid IV(A) lauroyltransferase